jgi:glycosyltransferase involved in cell wall biosynthesis
MPDSNQFGSPMKILEYMAMGVVPVAPDVEPIREIIQNHETGIIFKQRCVSEFVESISMLYRDEKLRLRVAQQASSYVLGNRLWRINAEKTISAIKPFL